MKLISTILVVSALVAMHGQVNAQYNQSRGTVFGGLTGAAAGAIIGENSDEAGAGAAIGGVVGALAGSVLGKAEDNRARYNYAAQQQYQYAQQSYTSSQAVSTQDVIAMARSGVGEGVIVTAIQNRGIQQPLQVADIVYLSQNGVPDSVIRTMQSAGSGGAAIAAAPRPQVIATRPPPRPVVIQYRSAGPRYGYGYGYGRPGYCPNRGYYR